MRGKHSLCLCGPGDGLGACTQQVARVQLGCRRVTLGHGVLLASAQCQLPTSLLKARLSNMNITRVTAAYKNTPKLVKHPVRRRIEPLQMLLWSARHIGNSLCAKRLLRRLAKKGSFLDSRVGNEP